jgi:hypothetical protein
MNANATTGWEALGLTNENSNESIASTHSNHSVHSARVNAAVQPPATTTTVTISEAPNKAQVDRAYDSIITEIPAALASTSHPPTPPGGLVGRKRPALQTVTVTTIPGTAPPTNAAAKRKQPLRTHQQAHHESVLEWMPTNPKCYDLSMLGGDKYKQVLISPAWQVPLDKFLTDLRRFDEQRRAFEIYTCSICRSRAFTHFLSPQHKYCNECWKEDLHPRAADLALKVHTVMPQINGVQTIAANPPLPPPPTTPLRPDDGLESLAFDLGLEGFMLN